jgi:pyridoxine 4-dehydrogenase
MELYQIHFPGAWANEAYWDGLGDCYDRGLVKAVGVSNYGSDAVKAVSEKLAARGIPLLSNQIQYSLAYPFANSNGLKLCGNQPVSQVILRTSREIFVNLRAIEQTQ